MRLSCTDRTCHPLILVGGGTLIQSIVITGQTFGLGDRRVNGDGIRICFARGGWQRQSAVGGDQADVDIVLTQPTTNEVAWVQVKSRSSQAELDECLRRFRYDCSFDLFVFYLSQRAEDSQNA